MFSFSTLLTRVNTPTSFNCYFWDMVFWKHIVPAPYYRHNLTQSILSLIVGSLSEYNSPNVVWEKAVESVVIRLLTNKWDDSLSQVHTIRMCDFFSHVYLGVRWRLFHKTWLTNKISTKTRFVFVWQHIATTCYEAPFWLAMGTIQIL